MTDVTPEPAPPCAGACAARAPARQRAAHLTRRTPRGRRSSRRWPARRLAYWPGRPARWPPTPASTTTSASRGSRERASGRHLRHNAARRRRAHQVGRPRLRHAARPRERRRNPLRGHARKPSPSRGAGASTGVTWPHPFDSTVVSRRWPRHAAWRCGCPDGTSTMTIASPSGSRATISMRPQGLRFGSSSITTSAAASRRHSWWTSRT
jgi:hypothetical protein